MHRRVFTCRQDSALYKRARYEPRSLNGPVKLHVRQGGAEPLLCRPSTTDAKVLWDTFYHRYHLPPRSVRPTGWILDLGANVGYTAAHFCWLYPEARVLAVEMDPDNAALCARNLAPLGARCELLRAAVWSHDGQVSYRGDQAWSLQVCGPDDEPGTALKQAPAMSLGTIMDKYAVETVDYLKMDIEGAEAEVLSGAPSWIRRVRAMNVEIHPPANLAECSEMLSAQGFHCRNAAAHPNSIVAVR